MANDEFRSACACVNDNQRLHCDINCDEWRAQERVQQQNMPPAKFAKQKPQASAARNEAVITIPLPSFEHITTSTVNSFLQDFQLQAAIHAEIERKVAKAMAAFTPERLAEIVTQQLAAAFRLK